MVGGGPVGLSAAVALGRAGIPCTVFEREVEVDDHPRARGVRTRTMEVFARWGLEDAVRREALPRRANQFIYCDSVAGAEVARSVEDLREELSPTSVCRVGQDVVRRVLAAEVADLREGVEITGVEDLGDHVVVRTSGGDVVADYVIAADGVGSGVRRGLGVEFDGELLGYGQSVYWRGDIGEWARGRLCIQFLTGDRAGESASVASVDGRERWVTMVTRMGVSARPEPPTEAEAREIVRRAVGADFEPEVVRIATWRISAQVARTWRVGRVFLVGDAAHSFPPTGGFGMNSGVQDVHNLAWKLAHVLRGRASPALLDTYEAERKAVAVSNAEWSVRNGVRMGEIRRAIVADDREGLDVVIREQSEHIDAVDQDLGFGYAPAHGADPLREAVVGHRFPHTPVRVGDVLVSAVLLPEEFTVLTADLVLDPKVLGGADAVVVRPDGIVAWAGDRRDADRAVAEVLRG
ncbi:FAD-dependent monooxygenase [Umezawaea sp. NPDC059074]|uniref:FAD-dependent monooxygenase n=1 Tax=Umezawaea sp. NPDC059074 TaxID=3346716 RepID=UPI0036828EE8